MLTLLTITGVYRDGKVELSQRPEGLRDDASVLVTFLPANGTIEPGPAASAADAEAAARRAAGAIAGDAEEGHRSRWSPLSQA